DPTVWPLAHRHLAGHGRHPAQRFLARRGCAALGLAVDADGAAAGLKAVGQCAGFPDLLTIMPAPKKPASPASAKPGSAKSALHPRNRHTGRYDFPALIAGSPELARFVILNPYGKQSIDFANPDAVRVFNRA